MQYADRALSTPLALALLVARIGADNVNPSFSPDNFAVVADATDAGSHFHGRFSPNSNKATEYNRISN
jgi:hypothetical protein